MQQRVERGPLHGRIARRGLELATFAGFRLHGRGVGDVGKQVRLVVQHVRVLRPVYPFGEVRHSVADEHAFEQLFEEGGFPYFG